MTRQRVGSLLYVCAFLLSQVLLSFILITYIVLHTHTHTSHTQEGTASTQENNIQAAHATRHIFSGVSVCVCNPLYGPQTQGSGQTR